MCLKDTDAPSCLDRKKNRWTDRMEKAKRRLPFHEKNTYICTYTAIVCLVFFSFEADVKHCHDNQP